MLSQLSIILILFTVIQSPVDHETTLFKITTKRESDSVEVKCEKHKVIFVIHSPYGIGNAVIERTRESWPDSVVLRLRLSGLENFEVSNGRTTVKAAVSSSEGAVRLWKNDHEDSELDADSADWMCIRIIDSDGKPTHNIPLKDGHFEIQLPKKLFADNPRAVSLKWIDFYRN